MRNKILAWNRSYKWLFSGFGDVVDNIEEFRRNPSEFKLVLFHGGSDVNPNMYKDTSPNGLCYFSKQRDLIDLGIFKTAIENKIPMVGVCRGIQFLNVMAGGKLMHHIENHAGVRHDFTSARGEEFTVTSTHHQMVIPAPGSHLIGWSSKKLSEKYIGNNDMFRRWDKPETEAMVFPKINACGVQFHPEMMTSFDDAVKWFLKMVESFINKPIDKFIAGYTGRSETIGYVRSKYRKESS